MTALRIFGLVVLLTASLDVVGQPSVLGSGSWHKLTVERAGVYRISHAFLRSMGIDPSRINPQHLRIHGRRGGMLPQPNAAPRQTGLPELAIWVAGESDGRFDKEDYILFYGEGPDAFAYDAGRQLYHYENNLYDDRNFYFLTVGDSPGKRIDTQPNVEGTYPQVTTFHDFSYYEKDQYNLDRSGREWFGEQFGAISDYTLTYNFPGIVPGSKIRIVSDVLGTSYEAESFKLLVNGTPVGEQPVPPIFSGRYSIRGVHRRDTLVIEADQVNAPAKNTLDLKIERASQGYLDFILVNVERHLTLYGNQTIFLSGASLQQPVSTFNVADPGAARIWDITDHDAVAEQEFSVNGAAAVFSANTETLRRWIIFNNNPPEPVYVGSVGHQDLSGAGTPNLLIVTHTDFKTEAERLAAHRSAHSGWTTLVVTTEEIFNEFSGGRQDVSAIRDYARHLYLKNPGALRSILLFGRSSYDYKDRIVRNTNFVPTYQSRNSLNPLRTYSSDDYFAFLEEDEGQWNESPAEHHTLDIGVGRLPVTTPAQARTVVDKIITYDTGEKLPGLWRKRMVFVADDGATGDDFTSLHQRQADHLATFVQETDSAFDTQRLFMGMYKKVVQPNGETAPEMADDLKRIFDLGALIVNFTGHGSERVWTDERILTDQTIAGLRNDRHPFLVTATCEFGRQDDPLEISSAEMSLTHAEGGSIGLVTTARPVNANTNFSLNQAFYHALLERDGASYRTLGEVFRITKNNSALGVGNRNFSLIGDPSMVLAIPPEQIVVTDVETATGSDTLKAGSTVTIRGQIMNGESVDTSFDGVVEATVYDREKEFVTIGRNDPPFQYTAWHNTLFRGKARVEEGRFAFSFIMPAQLAGTIAPGRVSLYAYDDQMREAKGAFMSFKTGGVEKDVTPDSAPPRIRPFLGDTTFVNGGIASPDVDLVAVLEDESGINISEASDHGIVARIDDGEPFALNEFYISNVDTYTKGMVRYPLLGLTPGPHTLTIEASDVFNNRTKATLNFIITDGEAIVIESFANYPNPVHDVTTFFFTHNRSGDDLKAQLFIFSTQGELVRSAALTVPGSDYHINLLELSALEENGKKLLPGLYFARLIVRSMTNGSKNEKVTKLIIVN